MLEHKHVPRVPLSTSLFQSGKQFGYLLKIFCSTQTEVVIHFAKFSSLASLMLMMVSELKEFRYLSEIMLTFFWSFGIHMIQLLSARLLVVFFLPKRGVCCALNNNAAICMVSPVFAVTA